MAEITQRVGTWSFDGTAIRVVPGTERQVAPLRKALGEVAVPLTAVAGISYESGRKGGRLRLRLRAGADPLSQVAGGRLPDAADPYQLAVERDRSGVAEYFVEEVRNALLLEGVPVDAVCDRWLLPGPSVPVTANGTDGTATFDGEHVRLAWNWVAEESKTHGGPQTLALADLEKVEWTPSVGLESGSLRFRPRGGQPALKPSHDPHALVLWGIRQARETSGTVLLAAAVTARLPHPHAAGRETPGAGTPRAVAGVPSGGPSESAPAPGAAPPAPDRPADGDSHDALLRRLRELGELHRAGVLTDEEFAAAKKAVLGRF